MAWRRRRLGLGNLDIAPWSSKTLRRRRQGSRHLIASGPPFPFAGMLEPVSVCSPSQQPISRSQGYPFFSIYFWNGHCHKCRRYALVYQMYSPQQEPVKGLELTSCAHNVHDIFNDKPWESSVVAPHCGSCVSPPCASGNCEIANLQVGCLVVDPSEFVFCLVIGEIGAAPL